MRSLGHKQLKIFQRLNDEWVDFKNVKLKETKKTYFKIK